MPKWTVEEVDGKRPGRIARVVWNERLKYIVASRNWTFHKPSMRPDNAEEAQHCKNSNE
jgi:hypothetical protein